jgi:hypothetical protein
MDTLSDLYAYVRSLIAALNESQHSTLGSRLSGALGGSTSGEILEGLWFVLKDVQQQGLGGGQVGDAIAYIERVLGPPRAR